MTFIQPLPDPWYRIYAVHGPAYDELRPGGFWGLGDELFWHARERPALGLVLIVCVDLEDANRLHALIDGLGLVAGKDALVS